MREMKNRVESAERALTVPKHLRQMVSKTRHYHFKNINKEGKTMAGRSKEETQGVTPVSYTHLVKGKANIWCYL